MTHKIHTRHLERLALVYVRQSSPRQVRHNVESRERQLRMQEHVRQLGWPATQVRLLGGDTGISGSSQHGRDDFQALLEAVLDRTAGIVAASELSRLARDNQDWNQLIRLTRYHDVLLADGNRVYDPTDPQDRVLLGVQGAFNEFELAMITERLLQCRQQKAERGELYEGFPPGYVCRQPPQQEKHPDERVQRAVRKVFDDFDQQASVYALFHQLQDEGFLLPFVPPGDDWRDVQWKPPSYDTLLGMLQHPAYAGIYVRGRRKVVHEFDAQGHIRRGERRVPRDEWEVVLPEHHEPYITDDRWERNMAKIAANAHSRGGTTQRSPGKGASLLAGLLRCRRCGHRLGVSYSNGVRYSCRGGALQRGETTKSCFSFAGSRMEQQVEELLLEVVRPAGIQAAERAAEQLVADRARQRRVFEDRVSAAREAESRAAREYKTTDETYRVVRQKLGAEWDAALQMLHEAEGRLHAFDASQPASLTAAEREQLASLSSDLERVWRDPRADGSLKKQITRTLIEEIIVDVDESCDELQYWVHWSGGHHTEYRLPRRRRGGRVTSDLQTIVSTLRKILADGSIATALNRAGHTTASGQSWTQRRVSAFRRQHSIAAYSASACQREGWLTQAEAATRLTISPMSVSRLVLSNVLPSEQPGRGLPTVIQESDLSLPAVQSAVQTLKSHPNRPLPTDPRQLSLFTPSNSSIS
jgi:DNA invertase Pin-like site-specific DNA recombinase